jgi:hypothetical protein
MALTQTEVINSLPAHLRTAVTPSFVDKLNNMTADPLVGEEFERNFISYTKVLLEGKYKTDDYLNAVAYTTYKLLGHSNQDAFKLTFPDRMRTMVAKGYDAKQMSSFVSAYHKGQLVSAILQQTIIPAFVMHQGKFHEAVGVLAEIAMDATALNKDRVAAADSLVRHLTPPQAKEVNINLGVQESSGMTELRASMLAMAQQQKEFIEMGGDVKRIAEAPLVIEGTATPVP